MIICLVGHPFTGKTVSACTFPKPLLLLSFEGGELSIFNAKDKNGKLIVPDSEQVVTIPFYADIPYDMDFKTPSKADFDKGVTPEHTKNAHEMVVKYNTISRQLAEDGTVTYEGVKYGPFKTLVIDSLTSFFRIWKDDVLYVNKIPELRLGDYRTIQSVLESQFIPRLKKITVHIPFVICIDHEAVDKDEITGSISEFPIGPSYSMGISLPRYFDAVLRQKADGGDYQWRTKAHGLFKGCGSRLDLPDPIKPPVYQSLVPYLEKKK